jgi:RNA polymerase sigma factor (TIGR02999 family)
MCDVTQILAAVGRNDPKAAEELWSLVYDELRMLAAQELAAEKPGQTLQATALVHEAYIRLVGGRDRPTWSGRGHFFSAAAEAMRRILVDAARRRLAEKRGGGLRRVELDDQVGASSPDDELLALDEALNELEANNADAASLVKLRYFARMSHSEAADALNISRRVADRLWAIAKAWLYQRLRVE